MDLDSMEQNIADAIEEVYASSATKEQQDAINALLESAKTEARAIEREYDGLQSELEDAETDKRAAERELENLQDEYGNTNGELNGFCEIRYHSNNLHDDAMMEILGQILESGFTTKDIAEHLETHFKDKIKTL